MKRNILLLLIAAVCLCGCMDTKGILYRGSMFGTMTGPLVFKGDDGNTYHFSNKMYTDAIPVSGRMVALFDVYSKVDGSENDYNAELITFNVPLTSEPVICTSEEEVAGLGEDPIKMEDGAVSGGYLNLLCSVLLHNDFKAGHKISLQLVPADNPDTLHLVLRHDAGEDKVTDETSESVIEYPFYASFPIEDKLPKDKTTVLELKWFWNQKWNSEYSNIKR